MNGQSLDRNQKLILAALVAATFAISLLYSFYFKVPPAVDARAYDTIAWNLVQGNGYRESLDTALADDNAIMRVGPGYEFFLAAIYFLFGHSYQVVWLIQALLLSASAFLVFFLAREVFKFSWNYWIGIIAAGLVGLSPDLITMQGMLMTETLGVFLIIATAYLFFKYINQAAPSWWWSGIMGLTLAAAAMVRTPAAFLGFPIAAFFLFNKQWKYLLIFLTAIGLVFFPWIARNFYVYGTFVPTNLAYGVDLLSGNHPGATGELEPYSVNDAYLEQYGFIQGTRELMEEALRFIVWNPLEFIKLTLYRISIYFSIARPTGFWFHLHGFSRALTLLSSAAYAALLFTFGLWGIVKIRDLTEKDKRRAKWLLAMLIMMPLAIVGIIVETRYRMLAYPFFAIFAGYGFWEVIHWRLPWRIAVYSFMILILNTSFDIMRNTGRIAQRLLELF